MARRVRERIREAVEYSETSNGVAVTYREARRDRLAMDVYHSQRGGRIPRDMARRIMAARPFVAWDGEGYNDAAGRHHYMLFGASTGDEISGRSLGTRECLDLLLRVEAENPDVFHVIFAGNYDVNMMLRDVDTVNLRRLKEDGECYWQGYRLSYIKSKWFRVSRGKTTITLYDVFTFFATSFVKALGEYLGEDNEEVQRIKTGKQGRDSFGYSDLESVAEYFRTELKYLVRLCNTLRDYLAEIGITLNKWHGPGAVASAILTQRKLKRVDLPKAVHAAGQRAYYGGRFEQFAIGTHEGAVYQYDIRSAYPAAIATLPRLGGEWRHRVAPKSVQAFSLYRVMYESRAGATADKHPFPWRHRNGAVFYPPTNGGTWVWGVELASALKYAPGEIRVLEAWEYDDTGERPYEWIAEYYDRRARWKDEKRAAQLALKLGMNSIYGKLAQQVGWRILDDGTVKLPSFHQLEYAGYITAHARAALYGAMSMAGQSLIATETDAVYSRIPLSLDVGEGLGQWEEKKFDGVIYVQSGLYFARDGNEWKHRTRGFGRGDVPIDRLRDWLGGIRHANDAYKVEPFTVAQKRFKTLGTSLGKEDWRTWKTEHREIHAGTPGGKREHYGPECVSCELGMGSLSECMHDMYPAISLKGIDYTNESTAYALEWQSDRPNWEEDGEPWDAVYA